MPITRIVRERNVTIGELFLSVIICYEAAESSDVADQSRHRVPST